MTTAGEVRAAARAGLTTTHIAISSFQRSSGRHSVEGWFRTLIDRQSGLTVMANIPSGSSRAFVTVCVGDREYVAIPNGTNEREWLVRDRDTGEQTDSGADGLVWLLGATGSVRALSDDSVLVELSKEVAIKEALDPEGAQIFLDGLPAVAKARVWLDDSVVARFLLDIPSSRQPKVIGSRRLVSIYPDSPPLDAPTSGEPGVERLAATLMRNWPTGERIDQGAPPDEALMQLNPATG